MSNTVGESTTDIKPGCTGMDVSAERYRIGTVWGGGTDVQTDRVANANVGATGAWHCFIAHLIRKPYSVGSPTAYNPNHLDNTNGAERAGIYEIWVDGVKLKGSAAATADAPNGILGPMYTGADREGRTKIVNGATVSEYNPRFRTGIYWGENNYEGGTITLYQDNIKLMSGEDLYNTVNCQ